MLFGVFAANYMDNSRPANELLSVSGSGLHGPDL